MSPLSVRIRGYVRDPWSAGCRALRLFGLGAKLPAGAGKYPRSRLASSLLGEMRGIEIGGSAANPFELKTRNVDVVDHVQVDSVYAREQMRVCGCVMPVDIIAPGDALAMESVSTDYVIASHTIEHFYDPIAAILEWVRVSRRFVYIIAPHKDRTLDHDRPVTSINELVKRNREPKPDEAAIDRHWSVWKTEDFVELVEFLELPIHTIQDADDKIGNGFTVVIGDLADFDRKAWMDRVKTTLTKCE